MPPPSILRTRYGLRSVISVSVISCLRMVESPLDAEGRPCGRPYRVVSRRIDSYFFLPGRCVSALPAAVFAALEDDGERKTFDAAVAAFLLVTSFLAMDMS